MNLDIYNELYDNDKYLALSDALLAHFDSEFDPIFLSVMVEIQDKAIAYSNLTYTMFTPFARDIVLGCSNGDEIFLAYMDFLAPFLAHYRNKGELTND